MYMLLLAQKMEGAMSSCEREGLLGGGNYVLGYWKRDVEFGYWGYRCRGYVVIDFDIY